MLSYAKLLAHVTELMLVILRPLIHICSAEHASNIFILFTAQQIPHSESMLCSPPELPSVLISLR